MPEGDSALAIKCMDFCRALTSQGLAFSFSLSLVSNFSFSLDTREMAPTSVNKDKAWKKKTPSTIRRNARRREEFLRKKQSPAARKSWRNVTNVTFPQSRSVD